MLRTRLLKTVYSANDPRQLPTAHAVGAGEAGPSGVYEVDGSQMRRLTLQ